MKIWAFDTETELVRAGKKAGHMACLTHASIECGAAIEHWTTARTVFEGALRDPNALIVGHYVAYDMAVSGNMWPDLIPLIFEAYAADRVTDTMLREKLLDISLGRLRGFADERGVWSVPRHDLESVARKRAGMALKKDGWRLRYAEFIDVPLSRWVEHARTLMADARVKLDAGVKDKDLEAIAAGQPEDVITYAVDDARATLAAYLGQEKMRTGGAHDPFVDEFHQARNSWWLTLMSMWGLRTNEPGVIALELATQESIRLLDQQLSESGLVRKDGSRDTKLATQRMLDVMGWTMTVHEDKSVTYLQTRPDARPLRKTKGNGISLDRDACKESGDEVLIAYGERAQMKAVQDKDVPMLRAGITMPIHSRFDIVASGRTSSSGPNIQNLRRLPGIREAFVPRDGWVFIQADYPQLELRTLAQACLDLLGHSKLAEMINAGKDPHLAFAATLLGITYEDAAKDKKSARVDNARQVGKVFNFGSPGGLGAEKLCLFARKTYGVTITIAEAKAYKRTWLKTFPEMVEYFAHVARMTDNPKGECQVKQLRSNRLRGGCNYTAACNTYFQGLGADATTDAGFHIAHACYVDTNSPLFGCRISWYVHDEFGLECPDTPRVHEAALVLSRIMRDVANRWVPEVPFNAPDPEPVAMREWSKNAVAVCDEQGRLVPWVPKKVAA